jgi:hypothetical protein
MFFSPNQYYFEPSNIDWQKYTTKKHKRKVKLNRILSKIN